MKKFVPTLLTSLMIMSCSQLQTDNAQQARALSPHTAVSDAPQNIIMIVGDGMGPAYTSAYRYFHDDPKTQAIEETVFDRHLVGSSSTYPARVSGYVTDSAAGATALATGTKSYNGAIGVDVDKKPVESVLVWAKKQGKKTGMVVTSQINHATPASYLAHNESRNNYNQIADSFLQAADNIDVIFGGGWQYFIREDVNLVNGFKAKGFNYIDSYNQLASLKSGEKALGLFADKGLPWALDDTNSHRLSAMTKTAISQLENEQGFFMLVEASQIDWGGHSNDIAAAMSEMDDLAKTLEYLEGYVEQNPNTLVVLTADHSTGGFTIGKDGDYLWQPDVLRNMIMSPSAIGKALAKEVLIKAQISKMLNFNITDAEFAQLNADKQAGEQAMAEYSALSTADKKQARKPSLAKAMHLSINHLIDQRTITGWTTFGHTGVDVPVFAMGKQKELFQGLSDNTDIAKKIFLLLGKN
ncbi:alkaline phosphatase [Cognaticolwellia aestuarii]|uniref:alkaline phosphatase n=1 Tax=Cognaticolwellia aestuarii TaxID=329993 RepID=UPI000985B79C|nr:alkaline phosphatase [Cognaticolwellia aestuarii]